MNNNEEEELFKALLDEPEYYEIKGKKIPIYSLGISVMNILLSSSMKIPDKIKDKMLKEEKLTVEEQDTLMRIQAEERGTKNSAMMKLFIKTLKITFPNKDDEELRRISIKHWGPLLKVIIPLNFPASRGENQDFQKDQLKKNN